MIPSLLVRELLPLPQGAAETATRLPWANGSLLSGRFEAGSNARSGTLILAGQRMLAQVPEGLPQGAIWLQLLDRNIPARFRILSQSQAEAAVLRMLQKMGASSESQQQASAGRGAQSHPMHDTQGTAAHTAGSTLFEQADTPYRFVPVGMTPPRWLLVDEREESPRGMLKAESDAKGFSLRGRLDLPNLGALSFTLDGAGHGMRLSLFSASRDGYRSLQSGFAEWLQQREERLDGSLRMGVPDEETGAGSGPGYS